MEPAYTALPIRDFCRATGSKLNTVRDKFYRQEYQGWNHNGKITITCPAILVDMLSIHKMYTLHLVKKMNPPSGVDFKMGELPKFASSIKGLEEIYYQPLEDGLSVRVYFYIINGKHTPALDYKEEKPGKAVRSENFAKLRKTLIDKYTSQYGDPVDVINERLYFWNNKECKGCHCLSFDDETSLQSGGECAMPYGPMVKTIFANQFSKDITAYKRKLKG